jgi:hypothetical protein
MSALDFSLALYLLPALILGAWPLHSDDDHDDEDPNIAESSLRGDPLLPNPLPAPPPF